MDFREVIYVRALELEMNARGLSFQREYEMDIYYKGQRIGGKRADFFGENCINRLNHDLPGYHDSKIYHERG